MTKFSPKTEKYKEISKAQDNFTAISNIRVISPFVDRTNRKNKNVVFRKVEANSNAQV